MTITLQHNNDCYLNTVKYRNTHTPSTKIPGNISEENFSLRFFLTNAR